MKKFTFVLIALIACGFAMQMNAQEKDHSRSTIYSYLPDGFEQVGETSLYYDIALRSAAGPGSQYGISILGEIDGMYYSSTYQYGGPGAGFIAALKVGNNSATYLNALNGTTSNGVTMTARVEPQGEVCARIVYTLTNNNNSAVTVQAGVWGDIMIGDNDYAPLSRLKNNSDETYGIKMKYQNTEDSPLLCALFGEGITGVTAADDYWFGRYNTNYYASEIVGNYYPGSNYMQENGSYDSGLGFCWKDRTIEAGESIELSYLISVGEVDFEEPIVPGEDVFTYNVEAYNFDGWNDLTVAHPAHIWGYYEHPYGQTGYIEYCVDGGEWIRIETPLTSGEEYDLPFDMMFNNDIETIHTLELRFTDGLDNYTNLDGLSWTDVRSYEVTGTEAVYNGEPHTFIITINGFEPLTFTTDYVVPGEYTVGSFEGNYDYNTIGFENIIVTIDKAPCVYDVELPFPRIEYDGDAHAATVTVPEGSGEVTIIYENAVGERTTEAPTEVGVYDVYIIITEGDYYYGIPETYVGQFEIYSPEVSVDELTVGTNDNGAWYTIDGRRVAAPTERGIYIHNGKKYIVK
jgi:hypothetical protein